MTVAEIERYLQGATWRMRTQAQYDYVLASLIGAYTARVVSNEVTIPKIEEAYPNLFEGTPVEERPQEDLTTKSVNNFLAAAMAINRAQKAKEENGGEQNT